MPTIDLGDFLERLERSQLLTAEDLDALNIEIEPVRDVVEVEPLGRKLVRRGQLTDWQLQMLLSGRDGLRLGNYRLLDLLGRGGMGTVLKAEHVVLGHIVAIKVMARRLVKSSRHVARFHQEIQAVAAIDHPHVVRAIDAESVGDSHFLVMEYVDGTDLGSVVERRGRLGVGEACELVRQAAEGLAAAHQGGLVHRDLKPSNLMLTWTADDEPLVKILDMGLARFAALEEKDDSLTKTGQMMGTPDYMSPEQAWDTKGVDIRGDIYSLGCTLFRFLIGTPPFRGDNPFQTLMIRTTLEAPSLRSLDANIPVALDSVVARMLRRDPAGRHQDPREVAADLAAFSSPPSRFDVEQTPAVEPVAVSTPIGVAEQPAQASGASLEQFLTDLRPVEDPGAGESPAAVVKSGDGGSAGDRRDRKRLTPVAASAAAGLVLAGLIVGLVWWTSDRPRDVVAKSTGPATVDRSGVIDVIRHPERTIDEQKSFEMDVLGSAHPLTSRRGDPALEFRLQPGGPVGVAVDRDGRLHWTPAEAQGPGRYRVVVEFRDEPAAAWHEVAEAAILVREVDQPPQLESPGKFEINELEPWEVRLVATDPDRPRNRIEYELGDGAPEGMSVEPTTGKLAWTPTESQGPGEFKVTVRATAFDAEILTPVRQQDEQTLVVRVAEVDQAPRLRPIPSLSMRVGQRLRLRVRADDPDEPAGGVRFSIQGKSARGASIDASTGIFSWAPSMAQAARNWRFRIRAASASNAAVFTERVFSLDVRPPRVTVKGQALPSKAERDAATRDVRDVYRRVLGQARTPLARSRLAVDLLEQARETVDPPRAFALFELAHQTSLRARRTAVALEVVRVWRQRFQVDPVTLVLESFKVLNLKEMDAAARSEISEQALWALVPAVNRGRLVEAARLLQHAVAAVRGDRREVARVNAAGGLLAQVTQENTAAAAEPLKLTPKGKVALGGLEKILERLRFTPVFRDAGKLGFVRHSKDDLEDLGRSLWTISGGDLRLETPALEAATGFWDKRQPLSRFRLRARVSADTTTGALLIGGPVSGGFDGLQLELRPDRFCQLFHRGSRQTLARPIRGPRRSPLGWDRLELVVRDGHVSVALNGQTLIDLDVPVSLEGFLGLDASLRLNQTVARLRLRQVRIRIEEDR